MLTSLSDRSIIGGTLYFEVPVAELTPADLGQLASKPKRQVFKVKLYRDQRDIPICRSEHPDMRHFQLHPDLTSQACCLCNHSDGGYIAHFRGEVSRDYLNDGGSLDLLADEIRPILLYQLATDNDMSVYQLLSKLADVQYHIVIK